MRFRNWPRVLSVFPVLVFTLITAGCELPETTEPKDTDMPISNERIVEESKFGTPSLDNAIYALYDDGADGFYFRGIVEDEPCAGAIDRTGQRDWIINYDSRPRDLYALSDNDIGLSEGVISVGGKDIDEDDLVDQAYIRLVGSGGSLIDELIISRVDTTVWLNSIDALGPLSFVAVGGALIDDTYHPFVTTLRINPDSTLTMNNQHIFTEIGNRLFMAVQVDAGQVTGEDFVCYLSATQYSSGNDNESIFLHAMTGSTVDTGEFSLEWTLQIAREGELDIWTSLDCFLLHGGTLYLCGSADVEKESNPGDGYWDAGIVASVSTGGTLNWMNEVILSTRSENYYGLYVTGDAVFATGLYSSYYVSDGQYHHGLALLSSFDPDTGDEIYHMSFGNMEYSSGFNALFVEGEAAFCAGYTNYYVSGGGRQAWFAEVDIGNLDGEAGSQLPELLEKGKGLECAPAARPMSGGNRIERR